MSAVDSNFQVIPMPRDGSCLFHAFFYFLQSKAPFANHEEIRTHICSHVLANWPKYGPYINGSQDYGFITTRNEYALYMSDCSHYGAYVEIFAASELFERNIAIYEHNECGSGYHMRQVISAEDATETMTLLYDAKGLHYDVLVTTAPGDTSFPLSTIVKQSENDNYSIASPTVICSKDPKITENIQVADCTEVVTNSKVSHHSKDTKSNKKRKPWEKRKSRKKIGKINAMKRQPAIPAMAITPEKENTPEKESKKKGLIGNRIVNVSYFFEKLKGFPHDHGFNCSLENVSITDEHRQGFMCVLKFHCAMCNAESTIQTVPNDKNSMDINSASICGAMLSGGGHTALLQIFSKMDIPVMSTRTYSKCHDNLCEMFIESSLKAMMEAAHEERRIAIEQGHVGEDGVPEITVIVDGSWSKRSYKFTYNSLGGVGAIVGFETKQVLFVAIKNKYCYICAVAENSNKKNPDAKKDTPAHKCFRNYPPEKASGQMEADAIKEGFQLSIPMYDIRYTRFIGDGDASVFDAVTKSHPYGDIPIKKVECYNHLLRNYCNKLKRLAMKSSQRNGKVIQLRRLIGGSVLRLRFGICKAVDYHKKHGNSIAELQCDILNAPYHVFGDHARCSSYFCKKKMENNRVPELRKYGLFQEVIKHTRRVAIHGESLMYKYNNNPVETYNSVICSVIGGKRPNYTARRSYEARCHLASLKLSHMPFYRVHKDKYKISPAVYSKKVEMQMKKKNLQKKMKPSRRKLFLAQEEPHGKHVSAPDMPFDAYLIIRDDFLIKLDEEAKDVEIMTRGQSGNKAWMIERKKRFTASNFTQAISAKLDTNTAKKVMGILYGKGIVTAGMKYGVDHEGDALRELQKYLSARWKQDVEIEECGLWIDEQFPFLAASPDGIIHNKILVEIKCPSSAAQYTPEEAIQKRKVTFWHKNGSINENHAWYRQIQGQLHVTEKDCCLLAVWTPKGLKVTKIHRDDKFWKRVESKIVKFYVNCLLPEILDSRKSRGMPIRAITIDGLPYVEATKPQKVAKKRKLVDEQKKQTIVKKYKSATKTEKTTKKKKPVDDEC